MQKIMSKINYIEMHKQIAVVTKYDQEIRPIHKAFIDSIFTYWNVSGWKDNFRVSRQDLMELSKISNRKTYYSVIAELVEMNYITYKPSKNPEISSLFGMGKKVTSAGSSDGLSIGSSTGSTGGTIHKLLNNKTNKLVTENASLINTNLSKWLKEEKLSARGKEKGSAEKEKVDWDALKKLISETTKINRTVFKDEHKDDFLKRLDEGYTKTNIVWAIKNSVKAENHIETSNKYLTIQFFTRPNTLDLYGFIDPDKSKDSEKIAPKMNV